MTARPQSRSRNERGQRLQFGQRACRAACGDLRGEVVLHQQQVLLGQPGPFGVPGLGGGQLRLATPASTGFGEPARGVVVVPGEPRDPGPAPQVLDGKHVQLGGPRDDPVAALQPGTPGRGERRAGPGDVRLHRLDRRRRRVVPEPVGERGRRDRAGAVSASSASTSRVLRPDTGTTPAGPSTATGPSTASTH